MIPQLKQAFPNLEADGYEETSPATGQYNCIAWAVGVSSQWWWPDPNGAYPWPEGIPRAVTVEAFLGAFATLRYQSCESAELETGFEKVALYSLDGKPTHAARQLPDGRWTSKLGKYLNITHALSALEGPVYGQPTHFLKRAVSKPPS
jgi:hypothetical protein